MNVILDDYLNELVRVIGRHSLDTVS